MTFRELREARGLTQFELAVRAGLQTTQISRIETGKVVRDLQYGIVLRLAEALGVSPDELQHSVRAQQEAA